MSAFMVSNKTLCAVTKGLMETGDFKDKTHKKLHRKLLEMNIASLQYRYPDSFKEMLHDGELDYIDEQFTDFEILKAMQCYRYQCSEGNIPKRKLYKQVSACIDLYQSNIINSLPEYDKVAWDL